MGADLVEAAAALRWARPDLTAELADHVLEEASGAGQQDRWLAAAGWAVHARAATGDGRDTACGVLAALGRWGGDALTGAAAHRLRIELAMVAAGAGEVESARRLLAPVRADECDPELTADLLCAHARCAVEDAPDEVVAALDAADAAWATVGGTAAQLGGASVALVRAVVERRAGRSAVAVDHAADGLARLERGRVGAGTPSGHLAAALAAEWISALLDAGRVAEARDGCGALLPRLSEQARPTRQLALLRLTVTRVLAAQDTRADTAQDAGSDTAQLLAQAAEDAAGSDVPDLEAVCRTALGALHEQADRLDVALEALQLAVGAERRDRDRSRRFLAALAELPAEPERPRRHREPVTAGGTGDDRTTSADSTMLLPAITRGDRKLRANRGEEPDRGKSRFQRLLEEPTPAESQAGAEPPAAAEEQPSPWDAVPWNGSGAESPIGDLLIRSWRSGSAEPSGNGSARRNGKSVSAPDSFGAADSFKLAEHKLAEHRSDEPDAPSGWMPKAEADRAGEEHTPARRRGRSADTDRRRSRRAREERDDTTSGPSRHSEPVRYPDDDSSPTADSADGSGEQERPVRSRRRSRHSDGDGDGGGTAAAGDRRARGRHGGTGNTDDSEDGTGRRSPDTRSGRAARRRAEEASATDPWSPRSDPAGAPESVVADVVSPVASSAASSAASSDVSSGGSDDSGESDGWLEAALAELDRALSGIGVGGPPQLEAPPPDDGCAVVVDISRDGRRFAGPRAAAVVRSVADLLADRLPPGARSRFGDSDALVVTGAGWSRVDATDWMHRTLPGLLAGFVAAEELPGAQLRVAVHDADGPVGAQILQPLAPSVRERDRAEDRRSADGDRDPWADLTASTVEERAQRYRAAAQAGRPERGSRGRRELDANPAEPTDPHGDPPRWPFAGDSEPTDSEPTDPEPTEYGVLPGDTDSPGRHGADRARPAVPAREGAVGRGRRHRAEAPDQASGEPEPTRPAGRAGRRRGGETPPSAGSTGNGSSGNGSVGNGSVGNGVANGAGPDPGGSGRGAPRAGAGATTATEQATVAESREPVRESTEGLGIADLLAGALAAYRGI